jgi:excisionase family DNA binding protein
VVSKGSERGPGPGRWLTLGEAARLLGVDETTLRSWADAGKVRVFRTPGGHRRFHEADLLTLTGGPGVSSRLEDLRGRLSVHAWLASRPWYARVGPEALVHARAECARLVADLGAYLEGREDRTALLNRGRASGAALGRQVARWALTPAEATEIFLYFKQTVTNLLASPPVGAPHQVEAIRDADVFLGEVLRAMMDAYGEDRGE